jgi:hypothetical protein
MQDTERMATSLLAGVGDLSALVDSWEITLRAGNRSANTVGTYRVPVRPGKY